VRRAAFDAITAQSESGNANYTPSGTPVTSPKGALYAMQVMPSTAHNPGFGIIPAQSDTPAEFNRVGHDYLNVMRQRYGNDPAKMWAAYNAGPGRVDSAIASLGSNWLSGVPNETRNYVRRNMGALGGY
jgi:soluble lytic murein transglycosylase